MTRRRPLLSTARSERSAESGIQRTTMRRRCVESVQCFPWRSVTARQDADATAFPVSVAVDIHQHTWTKKRWPRVGRIEPVETLIVHQRNGRFDDAIGIRRIEEKCGSRRTEMRERHECSPCVPQGPAVGTFDTRLAARLPRRCDGSRTRWHPGARRRRSVPSFRLAAKARPVDPCVRLEAADDLEAASASTRAASAGVEGNLPAGAATRARVAAAVGRVKAQTPPHGSIIAQRRRRVL